MSCFMAIVKQAQTSTQIRSHRPLLAVWTANDLQWSHAAYYRCDACPNVRWKGEEGNAVPVTASTGLLG